MFFLGCMVDGFQNAGFTTTMQGVTIYPQKWIHHFCCDFLVNRFVVQSTCLFSNGPNGCWTKNRGFLHPKSSRSTAFCDESLWRSTKQTHVFSSPEKIMWREPTKRETWNSHCSRHWQNLVHCYLRCCSVSHAPATRCAVRNLGVAPPKCADWDWNIYLHWSHKFRPFT